MKKISFGILCMMIFMLSINAYAEIQPTVSLICDEAVNSEETFDVYAKITENSGISGGRITVSYDNELLEILSISGDELLTGVSIQTNTAYTDTSARVSWAGINSINASGNLVKFTFKSKTLYQDTSTNICIENIKMTDSDTNTISVATGDVALLIRGKAMPSFSVISEDNVLTGSEIDVNITISENSLACGGRVDFVYDNTKFEVVSAHAGAVLSGATPFINTAYGVNKIRMSWAGTEAITQSGTILTIKFRVLSSVASTSEFTLESCKLTDNNDISIQCLSVNKTVNIITDLICSTKTTYSKSNNRWEFISTINNCPDKGILIVTVYNENSMVDMSVTNLSNDESITSYINNCVFDNVKIMVWDSLVSIKPLADSEEL